MSITNSTQASTAMHSVTSGASMNMPPKQKMSNLCNQIDTTGAGSIIQSQFNQAFSDLKSACSLSLGKRATAVWNALDPNGTGQVSQQNFVNSMKNLMVLLRQGNSTSSAAQTASTSTQALNVLG